MPLQPVNQLILNFPSDKRDWEGGGRQWVSEVEYGRGWVGCG